MTVEMEMMNEENGRLRRHIKTLEAELKKQDAAQAQAAVEPAKGAQIVRPLVEANCDEVICPNCCNQFRAIPVNVQQLMLDAGFEPPFKTSPAVEPVAYLAWRDGNPCYEGDDAVCEDAVWPVDFDDDRTSMPVYTAPQDHTAEIERLTKCLKKANSNHEEFERLWYLATDKSDSQQSAMRLALDMLHFMNDNGYRLEEYEQGRMDAAIAALEKHLEGPTP
jgi:hypothetical protein